MFCGSLFILFPFFFFFCHCIVCPRFTACDYFFGILKRHCMLIFQTVFSTEIRSVKQQNFIRHSCFWFTFLDISRSFKWKESFIFRYVKVFQVSKMFTRGLSDFLSCGRFVGCFCFATILVSSTHKLCQIWNTCIVSWIYWSIDFLNKLLIFILTKLAIKSYIY